MVPWALRQRTPSGANTTLNWRGNCWKRRVITRVPIREDNPEIHINTRPGSNIRGEELLEAVVQFWRDVDVNAQLNSFGDLGAARELQISGCGRFSGEPGYQEAMDCADRDPPGPAFRSSHAYEVATSNEILDMQRFNNSRLSCFSRSSRHCTAAVRGVEDGSQFHSGGTRHGPRRWKRLPTSPMKTPSSCPSSR